MTTVEYNINEFVISKKKLLLGFVFNKFSFLTETMYIIQFSDGSRELLGHEDLEPYYQFEKTKLA